MQNNKKLPLAIRMKNVVKTYGSGAMAVHAIKGVNLEVFPGEVVGLMGASGSGKTTLLQCLGAVIEPTGGKIELGGEAIYDNGWLVDDLRALRRDKIGFVFQAAYLIPFLSVLDNVAILPMLTGQPNEQARARAMELLTVLEVEHRAHAKPSQLSGGEQQRVAIARALANKPPFILADEPTAPLDSARSLIVMRLLTKLAEQYQTAIIVVTHDDIIIPHFKRLYRLRDGIAYEEQGEGLPFSE
ncbi:ABC transporter ATP-binding protein [uncultured Anaeromusa sp.]|uniref:ABC transporter ATP-binding protein n=1 Tax=uncultured Anaeromusa sp. TaxID=673273 RepID=UPI0029C91CC9|nr:ABC transporter ATP-binding protein [uncultured Anaeromusa sp.]